MIVDDDPDLLICLRMIFEHEDYEVLTVDSGKDCLKELERGFHGIVLMDLMMPFMDGWKTLDEIVHRGFDKSIILSIITASGNADTEKLRQFGPYIHDYIAKPFDVKKLVSKMKKITT